MVLIQREVHECVVEESKLDNCDLQSINSGGLRVLIAECGFDDQDVDECHLEDYTFDRAKLCLSRVVGE